MEPVAVPRSQLSVLGQFQDGAEALESVAMLWRFRSYRDIIIIIIITLGAGAQQLLCRGSYEPP